MKQKRSKLRNMVARILGVTEWKIGADGHLDIDQGQKDKILDVYGQDFMTKFEDLIRNESNSDNLNIKKESNMSKIEMKMALLCALLDVDALEMTDEGVFLNQEQLDLIEAELAKQKDLQVQKDNAVLAQAAAEKAQGIAEDALSDASAELDDLDESVTEAESIADKVEAVRKKLAEKPAAAASGAQDDGDDTYEVENADEVSAYVQKNL